MGHMPVMIVGMKPWLQTERRVNDYLVRITMAEINRRHEVVGVEIWGITPPTDAHWQRWGATMDVPIPVTTEGLRIPLQRIVEEILADLDVRWKIDDPDLTLPRSLRGRRVLRDDAHWREVRELVDATPRGHRLRAIADRWSVSMSTAGKWSARARALDQ